MPLFLFVGIFCFIPRIKKKLVFFKKSIFFVLTTSKIRQKVCFYHGYGMWIFFLEKVKIEDFLIHSSFSFLSYCFDNNGTIETHFRFFFSFFFFNVRCSAYLLNFMVIQYFLAEFSRIMCLTMYLCEHLWRHRWPIYSIWDMEI